MSECKTCSRLPLTRDGVRIVVGRDEVWFKKGFVPGVWASGSPGEEIYWDAKIGDWLVDGTRCLGDDRNLLVSECYSREELVPSPTTTHNPPG